MKRRLFPITNLDKISTREPATDQTREPATEPEVVTKAKTKSKISSLKLRETFLNEIKNNEKNINEQILKDSFGYHSASLLVKYLYKSDQNKK